MTHSLVEPGRLTILYGAVNSGKTAVAVGIGETLIRAGKKVVYFGMPKDIMYTTKMMLRTEDRIDMFHDAQQIVKRIVAANELDSMYVILDQPVVPDLGAISVFLDKMPVPVGVLLVVPEARFGGLPGTSQVSAEAEAIFHVQKDGHAIIMTVKKSRCVLEEIDVATIEEGVNAWARAKKGEPDIHWTVLFSSNT